MSRPVTIWTIFCLCLLLVLGSMGWASMTVFRLDEESSQARQQAVREENIRLALWRMDSIIAPLIGRENSRPVFAFESFYPAERAYTRMFAQIQKGEILMPSPLLVEEHPHIRLHFELEPQGRLSSPQVPQGNMMDLAQSGYVSFERIQKAKGILRKLVNILDRKVLVTALSMKKKNLPQATEVGLVEQQRAPQVATRPPQTQRKLPFKRNMVAQQQLGSLEYQARYNTARQIANLQNSLQVKPSQSVSKQQEVGAMQPVWIRDQLYLVRRVVTAGRERIQGCWLDWASIRKELVGHIAELLPKAQLEPVRPNQSMRETRTLASLPVALLPGQVPVEFAGGFSPIQISMLIAWICMLLAAGAVAVLLRGALVLSERRGAFVSAVTHELRTPLTTFRMYTEMLADGMVPDPSQRQRYLETLHAEADRLDHLVQNVLSYARLERNRVGRIEPMQLGQLIDGLDSRLAERARQSNMMLEVEISEAVQSQRLRCDPDAVERILLNLVDNACNYASDAQDKRIHIQAERTGPYLVLRVRDHGSGLNLRGARRLFKPFSKSAKEAAETAPGVGLGLALSHRLASRMGGTLRLDPAVKQGACFMLSLPAV